MRALMMKKDGEWVYVFCHIENRLVQASCRERALKGKDALRYFKEKFGCNEFKLEEKCYAIQA